MALTFNALELQSGTWNFKTGHVDRQGAVGDFLVGRSQEAETTMTTNAVSDVTPTSGTTGLVIDTGTPRTVQNNFREYNVTGHLYLAAPSA